MFYVEQFPVEGIISETASAPAPQKSEIFGGPAIPLRPLPKPVFTVFGPLPLIWPRVAIGFRKNTLYLKRLHNVAHGIGRRVYYSEGVSTPGHG